MTRAQELSKGGWEKQGIYDESRLSELIDMYEEIGFEVHLEPFDIFTDQECAECMKSTPEKYKTLYTRKKN